MPKHVHVEKVEATAKFNTEFIELIKSSKFSANELKRVRNLVEANKEFLIQKWDEYFNN